MKTKLLLVHNIIAPYRLPLFNEISNKVDLTVAYIHKNDKSRLWEQNDFSSNYDIIYLDSIQKKILGKNFVFLRSLNFDLNSYDIIILPDDQTYFLVLLKFLREIKNSYKVIKIVFWTGNFSYYRPFDSRILNNIVVHGLSLVRRLFFYQKAHFFWSYSEDTTKLLRNKFRISESKISTGLQGYPDSLITLKNNIDFSQRFNDNRIVYLGYISPRKGLNILVDVFTELRESSSYNNLKLDVIGNETNYGREIISKNSDISFLGYKDGVQKFQVLNECKVLVLPSFSDPWGWVVNEAMSIGLPVIVTEGVMAKEMVKDKKMVCRTGDSLSLKKSLKYILNMNINEYKKISLDSVDSSKKNNLNKALVSFDKILNNVK